jgi:Nucleotidyltransferase of unknown function (DUF6036)
VSPIRIEEAHFSPDTRSFISLLAAHGVRYLIVGGEAVILHGHVRLTGDVDFFFAAEEDNVARLFAAIEDFWDGDVPGLRGAEELLETGVVVQFGLPPNRIDVISSIDGVTFAEAWPGRVEAVLVGPDEEVPMWFIGVEALVKNKRASGRAKDLDDLDYLIAE